MLVADDEDGGGGGALGVARQFLQAAHVLGLAQQDELAFGHHGEAAGGVHDLEVVGVLTVGDGLVEGALVLLEGGVGDGGFELVDEVGFRPVEEVDGGEITGADRLQEGGEVHGGGKVRRAGPREQWETPAFRGEGGRCGLTGGRAR